MAERKVRDYLLSPDRSQGKAAFFQSIGFSQAAWHGLREALREHAASRPCVTSSQSIWGEKFALRCGLSCPSGSEPCVVTVWIIRPGSQTPDFVTAYPA